MTTQMHSFIEALGWSLLHFFWQGAVIAAVLGIALTFLRKRSAPVRYALASIALASLPVVFVITLATAWSQTRPSVAPIETIPPLPAAGAAPEAGAALLLPDAVAISKPAPESKARLAEALADLPAQSTPAVIDRVRPALPWIVAGWILGVLLLSLRLLTGWHCLRRLRRSAAPADARWRDRFSPLCDSMGVSRAVRLLSSTAAPVPMVVGWLKPVVLVPAELFTGLNAAQLEAVLAHEIAHIRRHDYLANLLQSLLETVFFFHPAVWWISGVMRREREHCCDDAAAENCGSRVRYARSLAALEELRECGRAPLGAVAATDGSLLGRVRRLLGVAGREPVGSLSWQASAVAAVLALSLAIGAHFVKGAEDDPADEPAGPQVHTATRAGTWELAGGVELVIRQEVVHGADVLTTAVVKWPKNEAEPARNVQIHVAADAFANRQPWAVAWEEGKPELWIAGGELRSFREANREQPEKATTLRRLDFRNSRRIEETYFTGWPVDGKPSAKCIAAMNAHLQVNDEGTANRLAIHWATTNPATLGADSLRFTVSIDKSGETAQIDSGEDIALDKLEKALRAEAKRRQDRWKQIARDQDGAMPAHARPVVSVFASPDVPFTVMTRVIEACRAAGVGPEPAEEQKQAATTPKGDSTAGASLSAEEPKRTSMDAPTVRGVDLAGIPQHDEVTQIAELYEPDPEHPGHFRRRPGVFFMGLGKVGPWLYVPANANRFYLSVRPDPDVVKDTIYGPIEGDAAGMLDLAGWLRDSPRSPGYARRVARNMMESTDHSLARVAIAWLGEFDAPSPPDEHEMLSTALARNLAEFPNSPVAADAATALQHLTTLAEEARVAWDKKRERLPDERYSPGKPITEGLAAISWGEPAANGLRLGIAGIAPKARWAIGDVVPFEIYVRNDGDEPVKFAWTPRLDDGLNVTLTDAGGREWRASIMLFSTLLFRNHCRLDPGHVLKLKATAKFAIVRADDNGRAPGDLSGRQNFLLVGGPGDHRFRASCSIGIRDWSGGEGREIVRPVGEWAGTLESETIEIIITNGQHEGAADPAGNEAGGSGPVYLGKPVEDWNAMLNLNGIRSEHRETVARLGYGTEEVEIPSEAIPMLLALVESGEPATQCRCLGTLRKLDDPSDEVLNTVFSSLDDLSSGNRHRAAYLLAHYQPGRDDIVPRLIELLRQNDPTLQDTAAFALARIGPAASAAIPALEALRPNAPDTLATTIDNALRALRSKE